jgi:hypothetical protein
MHRAGFHWLMAEGTDISRVVASELIISGVANVPSITVSDKADPAASY